MQSIIQDKNLFTNFSNQSRIWMYLSSKKLTDIEIRLIEKEGANFTSNWTAHGAQLDAELKVIDNHLLVLALNEATGATGCSIDSSTGFFRMVDSELNLDLFNRMKVGFLLNDEVKVVGVGEFEQLLKTKECNANTPVFDLTIGSVGALNSELIKKTSETWLSRYL